MILPKNPFNRFAQSVADRTVMLIDPCFNLLALYIPALGASGWRVVGVATTLTAFLHQYQPMLVKPQLLIVEYKVADNNGGNIVSALEQILQQNPTQQILFVTAEERLLREMNFLPPSLHHVPIILKSTHTIDEMVADLDELPFYYPPM